MNANFTETNIAGAVISLSKWLEQTGITSCTAWRWRKKGWLQTVNICGRVYLTAEAIEEFNRRAAAGDFSRVPVVPKRNQTISGS